MTGIPKRPVPSDFRTVVKRLTARQMSAHYKASHTTIRRWLFETGTKPAEAAPPAMPTGFRETAKGLDMKEVARLYNCSFKSAARWMRQAGMNMYQPAAKPNAVQAGNVLGKAQVSLIPPRDITKAGSAADFLRCQGWYIHRLSTVQANADPDLWQMGTRHVSTVDLIEKALSKGWSYA